MPLELTVKEAIGRKKALESKLLSDLTKFEKDTGIIITKIKVKRTPGMAPGFGLDAVNFHVELGIND